MIQTVTVTNRGQLTIPADLRKALDIKEGMEIIITKIGDKLSLLPIRKSDSIMRLYGSLKPKGKVINPNIAIEKAKKIKAKEYYEKK